MNFQTFERGLNSKSQQSFQPMTTLPKNMQFIPDPFGVTGKLQDEKSITEKSERSHSQESPHRGEESMTHTITDEANQMNKSTMRLHKKLHLQSVVLQNMLPGQ